MGCLFLIFAGAFPRVGLACLWIFTSEVDQAFDSFVVPLLGLLFLPLTTLVYALAWTPAHGVTGIDWLWVGLAFLFDLASYGAGERERRARAASPAA